MAVQRRQSGFMATIILSHKIALAPTKKQDVYFRQASGISRLAYNWALAEWNRQYLAGEKPNEGKLRKQLNAIKREQFPFMLEVTKCAPQQAIKNLGAAYKNFFSDITKMKAGQNQEERRTADLISSARACTTVSAPTTVQIHLYPVVGV